MAATLIAATLSSESLAHPGPGIVVGPDGTVYFIRVFSNIIITVGPDDQPRTFVQDERWRLLHHLQMDGQGNLYTASDFDGKIWVITPDGDVSEYFDRSDLLSKRGIVVGGGGDPFALDAAGNVYCLDRPGGNRILRITPEGDVSHFAGSLAEDPDLDEARFGSLHFSAMAWGPDSALYVTDNTKVWRLERDGSGTKLDLEGETFGQAVGIDIDPNGNIFVADYRKGAVLRISASGVREWLEPRFSDVVGVAVGPSGALYVTQSGISMSVWRVAAGKARRLYRYSDRGSSLLATLTLTTLSLLVIYHTWTRQAASWLDWIWWTAVAFSLFGLAYHFGGRADQVFAFLRHGLLVLLLCAVVTSYTRTRLAAGRASPPPRG